MFVWVCKCKFACCTVHTLAEDKPNPFKLAEMHMCIFSHRSLV